MSQIKKNKIISASWEALKEHIWNNRLKYAVMLFVGILIITTIIPMIVYTTSSALKELQLPLIEIADFNQVKIDKRIPKLEKRITNFDVKLNNYFEKKGNHLRNTWLQCLRWLGETKTKMQKGELTGTTRLRYRLRMGETINCEPKILRKAFPISFSIKPELLVGEDGKIKARFEHEITSGNCIFLFVSSVFNMKRSGTINIAEVSELKKRGVKCKKFRASFKKEGKNNEDLLITVACDER